MCTPLYVFYSLYLRFEVAAVIRPTGVQKKAYNTPFIELFEDF
jgi:DNA-dependent RNA polymerase auxiliary subunit epsilon